MAADDHHFGLDPDGLNLVRLKGLIVGHPPSIFSTVFEAFARSQPASGQSGSPAARHRPTRLIDPGEAIY